MAVWTDVVWGAALVLVGRGDALHYLARCIRLSDRLDLRAAYDEPIPLLAIAAARIGRKRNAAMLIGDREAHRANRLSEVLFWLAPAIEEVLEGVTDRAIHTAAGAMLTRSQVIALVNEVEVDAHVT